MYKPLPFDLRPSTLRDRLRIQRRKGDLDGIGVRPRGVPDDTNATNNSGTSLHAVEPKCASMAAWRSALMDGNMCVAPAPS